MDRIIKWGTIAVIALFVFVFVVAAPAYTIASYHNENTYVIKVTDKETKTVDPHKAEIYSIKDNAKTSGSFVLGSGAVGEKQYLYFVKEKDGFKTVSKAAVEDSKMKEGKYAKPYVLTYDVQFKSAFARFFYGKSTGFEAYEFYLPEDTITTEYKIDLE
ncbi:hypothetical protein [Bacillus velezensis]|uniref:hypothetical protein n=1 Tax=Bacillus velezensis TaxID=492670 RepID=UPI0024AEF2E4|nr:hypothetical protein [Bacillus velezensis]WHM14867.1 hypothetical protein QLX65_07165 [Bacillus velezensis]